MVDFIVAVIIIAMVGFAIRYIVRAKKAGVKCVGCSAAGACAHAKAGSCTCGTGSCHADLS